MMTGKAQAKTLMVAALALLGAACACAADSQAPSPPERPRSFAYVLQAERLGKTREQAVARLASCGRDWLVLDPSYDGGPDGRWSAPELQALRAGKPGRKLLAYLSIGEAESYRAYWRREWDAGRDGRPDARAPAWLAAENPEWKGNYRVKYWDAQWQALALEALDAAVSQGFDGAYLDLVDAFETFEYDAARKDWVDDRENPETGRTYRQDMHAWVSKIAERARRAKPGFLVIPQNGSQLLARAGYAELVDGIGVEDLFTDGNRTQPREHVDFVLGFLKRLREVGKPVLVIEYGVQPKARRLSAAGAKENGFVALLTDRELKTLGEAAGAEKE